VMAGLDVLHNCSDLASVLDHAVAHFEILQRNLVSELDCLCRVRLESFIVGQVSADTIRTGCNVHHGNADIVGGLVDKKMNHSLFSPLLRTAQQKSSDSADRNMFRFQERFQPFHSKFASPAALLYASERAGAYRRGAIIDA